MRRRAGGAPDAEALRLSTLFSRAAALATTATLALAACGEEAERIQGPSRADLRSLVAAGLAAAGSDAAPSTIAFRLDGSLLRIRATVRRGDGPLLRLAASSRGVRAQIEPFCPKPAVLRCRPALRASVAAPSGAAVGRSVAALRRLAERTYGERPRVRRRGAVIRLATANGELLAAVRRTAGGVALSFGGLDPPRAADAPPAGRVRFAAGPAGLAVIRPLQPSGLRRALVGVRRLVVWLSLDGVVRGRH